MNAYITLTYPNGAPCILRTDRIIRKREMPGGKTEIIYGNNEKITVKESLIDVHDLIECAERKKRRDEAILAEREALKAVGETEETEANTEENPTDADRGTEMPPESILTIDRINLATAIDTPFWRAVWAAEPSRQIDVRMTYEDLKIICDTAEERINCSRWRSVDERPTEEGTYWCVLIYDEYKDSKPTGRKCATVEMRWFGDISDDVARTWVMKGEPETGLVWTEEVGSWSGEQVWAWRPTIKDDVMADGVKLPDGVVWSEEG